MANRTDSSALSVHGTNPQYLIEKIVRLKIHSSQYWKEHCYALTAETLVDKAVELEYIGGTYGGARKPAPFLCLVLKMLQLQPELEIVYEFIKNEDYKYVTALGCFYLRLIGKPEDIYTYLEPLYNNYKKLRYRETDGKYRLIHMDEFIEELLLKEALCDTILPRLTKRQILEDNGTLQLRHSVLEDLEEDEEALLAEIKEDEADAPKAIAAGPDELIENPRAAALKPDRSNSPAGDRKKRREEEDDEERRRRKEKKRQKKEKKKNKYRTRGSLSRSRSRSRHRDESDRSEESKSRSRSRSRSEKKKKKSKWKKNLKERRKDKHRERSRDRSKSKSRSRSGDRNKRDKNKDNDKKEDGKVDENSEEYWMSLRAKLGLKPL